ncbi:hypothetical protein D3C71_2045020 [compost metagenome]
MVALIDDGQQTVAHGGDPLRIAPTHQRHLAQHVALQRQLDQERFIAHDRKQGFGLRVVGQVGSLVLFHARQHLGVDHRPIVR